jgi:hypothetical protein
MKATMIAMLAALAAVGLIALATTSVVVTAERDGARR